MLENICKRHWNLVKPGETVQLVAGGRIRSIGVFTCDVCDVLDRVRLAEKLEKEQS